MQRSYSDLLCPLALHTDRTEDRVPADNHQAHDVHQLSQRSLADSRLLDATYSATGLRTGDDSLAAPFENLSDRRLARLCKLHRRQLSVHLMTILSS